MAKLVLSAFVATVSLARPTIAFAPSMSPALSAMRSASVNRNPLLFSRQLRTSPFRTVPCQQQRGMAVTMAARERTFIMIKPDAVQRGLVGDIIKRFEQKGFKLVGLKFKQADEALLKEHYKDLVSKPFFPSLLKYMTSGPVVPMVWEGNGVVAAGRTILGATKPSESAPGTVRGDYAIDVGRNVCHGSDAVETAKREIGLWFPEGLTEWTSHSEPWIYE